MASACTFPAMNLTSDHHADECVGMIDPTMSSNVALSSTQQEMPGTIKTTAPPVVFMMAPIHSQNNNDPTAQLRNIHLQG